MFFLFIHCSCAILASEVIFMLRLRRIAALVVLGGMLLLVFGCTLFNSAPVASFLIDPATGPAPLTVQLDASASFDPDGDTIVYQWDLGDGAFSGGMTTTHTYTTPGQYTIRLTVTDAEGQTNITQRTLVVRSTTETPVASFTASPSSGGTPLTVAFNASASSDPNGSIVSYAWSFGDGSSGTGVMPLHTYAAEGTYNALLTITDDEGLKDSVMMVIVVIDGGQGGCQ